MYLFCLLNISLINVISLKKKKINIHVMFCSLDIEWLLTRTKKPWDTL